MQPNVAQYPGQVYDGTSPERDDAEIRASCGPEDWEQLVVELQATQTELDTLKVAAPLHAKVTVTSAEILACNTAPVTLLPAPGAGLAHVIERVTIRNEFLTGAYTYTTIANLSYTDESGAPIIALLALFLEAAATTIMAGPSTLLTGAGASTSIVANAPVVFAAPDADPTTGAGSLVIDIWYNTIATV